MDPKASAYAARIAELRESFRSFDLDGNGAISPAELSKLLFRVGSPASLEEVKSIIAAYDVNADGEIELGELVVHYLRNVAERPEALHAAFAGLDADGDGKVELAELRPLAASLWEGGLTEDEVVELGQLYDRNGDGQLTYDELVELLLGLPYT
jgi:Ca2+-binding EF-hand superfamily protein